MKRFLAAFCAIWMASCTGYVHEARSVAGNYERDILVKIGGTASQKGADGSSIVTDDQQSFSDGVTALGTYGAAKVAGNTTTSTTASNNSVTKNAANNATKQQGQSLKAATANKKLDVNQSEFNTAVGAGATPSVGTVNPINP